MSFWGLARGQSRISFLSLEHKNREHSLFHPSRAQDSSLSAPGFTAYFLHCHSLSLYKEQKSLQFSFALSKSNGSALLIGEYSGCIYITGGAVHLGPPVTRFIPIQHEMMGSEHLHSSPFSGSGNPVSALWVCI